MKAESQNSEKLDECREFKTGNLVLEAIKGG